MLNGRNPRWEPGCARQAAAPRTPSVDRLPRQYVGQFVDQVFGKAWKRPSPAVARATLHELYRNCFVPLPIEVGIVSAAVAIPSMTFNPVTVAPATVLLPFEVSVPPTSTTPDH